MTHEFQPIDSEEKYLQALEYICEQSHDLARAVLSRELTVNTLTIFAQSNEEYEFVYNLLLQYGAVSKFAHGTKLYVDADQTVCGQRITLLGVGSPDKTRSEVGYADFPVADYESIKAQNLPGVQEIRAGSGIDLLELRHHDFDVRGYLFESHKEG